MLSEVSANPVPGSRLERLMVRSTLLAGNPSGMPAERPLTVYLPEAACDKDRRFPVLYLLPGWTGAGRTQFEWDPFRESMAARLDRLIQTGRMAPVVVVAVDLFTWFGGSQFVNSAFFGPHADHIVHELIPFVEARFPVLKGNKHRGVFGKSSGGFGALRLALDYPGIFHAMACHSGDMGFEWCHRASLINLCNGLKRHDYDPQRFLDYCHKAVKLQGSEIEMLMHLGMGGFYSPSSTAPLGFDMPIDYYDGSMREDVWALWQAHDPLERVEASDAEGVRKLGVCYFECGVRDQYNLQYGARQLAAKLKKRGIAHTYEEFDDNHSNTAYRYDVSLPRLVEALS